MSNGEVEELAYSPTNWVDGTTPINATNLNKLENGLQAAAAIADGAVPKAIVDAKGDLIVATAADVVARLPVGADGLALVADAAQAAGVKWAAVAAGGGGTDWEGAYNPATAYVKGDVVTYQGVTYVAVNDSTGQTPPTPGAAGGIGTALPGGPVDGQEFILVDSLTAPTFSWRLRYLAAKATNKWLFVGGVPLLAEIPTLETTTTGATYGDLPTAGPSLTAPVVGQYLVTFAAVSQSVGNVGNRYMAPKFGAAAALDADGAVVGEAGSTPSNATHSRIVKRTIAAGTVVKMQYRHDTAQGAFGNRWVTLVPVAVGG